MRRCGRVIVGGAVRVTARPNPYNPDGSPLGELRGLSSCGSVWSCPVCSVRVTLARRRELLAGLGEFKRLHPAGSVQLFTFTTPHGRRDGLQGLVDSLAKARRRFAKARIWERIEKGAEVIGTILGREVTVSDASGWHPHYHQLVLAKRQITDDEVSELKRLWLGCLRAEGLASESYDGDVLSHGLDVRSGDKAAEYVAKFGREPRLWNEADELTSSHAKVGRRSDGGESFTPFELLARGVEGDEQADRLYAEYVSVFDGLRMLVWSKGLKALLRVEEVADELLASDERAEEVERLVGVLAPLQFKVLAQRGVEDEFLEYAVTLDGDDSQRQAAIDAWVLDARRLPIVDQSPVRYRVWRGDRPVLSAAGEVVEDRDRYWALTGDL